ncbi:uncharacterized protein [Dysidea avara]|uniref:uncharacterized protein n=1 Tax=Dysidea avara TaxID=196820 RepID=UPI00332BE1A2
MADKTGVEFLAAWEQLDDASKNKLLQSIQDDPLFEQPRVTSRATKGAADIESIEATAPNVYSDIQLRPYLSYLYYYPTIQWSLDKTPDTDNYWVGLYAKDEKNDKKYLAYQWILKTAQGSYKVGKLKTTEYKYGSSRIEEYEVHIFKQGYQRLDAQSNILRGVVSHLPTNIFSPGAGKLISSQDRRQSDEELNSFLAGIQGDANTTALAKFSSPADALKQWATFTPIQKQLMFPILEQDSLPETIKKPGDRGTDHPESNVYFADHSKLGGVTDPSEAPSQIVLTITLDYSSTYTYPEVDVENEVPSEGAWLGVYRTQGTTDFDPDGYIKSQYVGRGQKGSHKLSYIKEDNPGPTKSTYIGPIFDKKKQTNQNSCYHHWCSNICRPSSTTGYL